LGLDTSLGLEWGCSFLTRGPYLPAVGEVAHICLQLANVGSLATGYWPYYFPISGQTGYLSSVTPWKSLSFPLTSPYPQSRKPVSG